MRLKLNNEKLAMNVEISTCGSLKIKKFCSDGFVVMPTTAGSSGTAPEHGQRWQKVPFFRIVE
jgi:hypothetical protein